MIASFFAEEAGVAAGVKRQMFSRSIPRVFGPNSPITSITISMLATINAITPSEPPYCKIMPMMMLLNTVDRRLKE